MSEHTISNQTCTKCQNCGQWTNYAGDEHHQSRETEFAALRKDSDYLVTSELMRAEVIQQRDELLAAAKIGEGFMSGFEGDELQEGIDENLATIRAAIAKVGTPAVSQQNDFAKIIRATDGRQVLFYVEPAGGDYHVHQVANHDGFQADLTIGFTYDNEEKNERLARAMFNSLGQDNSNQVIQVVERMVAGGDA